MNYTLNQLRVFLKVVQNQSVTKASEELHLTQPAVSIQLKNFQDQFEIPLTEVVGRKIYVTDFGKEIAEAAEQILQQVGTINYKTLAYKGQLFGKLKLSIVSTGKYIIPFFLSDFLKSNPGVELSLDVTNKVKVLKSLEKNEVDFSLVSILPENFSIYNEELMDNKLFLIANKDFKITKKIYNPEFLNELNIIYRENGSGTRWKIERFFETHNLKINKKLELTSNEAVKQAVLAGLGVSIMPLIGLKNELLNNDLQIIPLKGLPLKTNWNLIWHKQKSLSPVAKAYLDFIKENKIQIIENKFKWYEKY